MSACHARRLPLTKCLETINQLNQNPDLGVVFKVDAHREFFGRHYVLKTTHRLFDASPEA
jgi:hypothetical protein